MWDRSVLRRYPDLSTNCVIDPVLTGSWGKRAYSEARHIFGARMNIAANAHKYSKDNVSWDNVPPQGKSAFSLAPSLIYCCNNEMVEGIQLSPDSAAQMCFPFVRLLYERDDLPPVSDYSSSFMFRHIPHLCEHIVIFASVQKNVGPAGLTILVVRQDCLVDVDTAAKLSAIPVPLCLTYKTIGKNKSLHHTPLVLSIHITRLMLEHTQELGELTYFEGLNRREVENVHAAIRAGKERGVFQPKVQSGSLSWMDVVCPR